MSSGYGTVGESIPGEASVIKNLDTGFVPYQKNLVALPDDGMVPVSEMVVDVTNTAETVGRGKKRLLVSLFETDEGMEDDGGEIAAAAHKDLEMEFPLQHKGHKLVINRKNLNEVESLVREEAHAREWQENLPVRIQRMLLKEFWDRILAGDTAQYGLAYDAQAFFDIDHTGVDDAGVELTNQANLFTGAAGDLTVDNLTIILNAMEGYFNHYGSLFNRVSATPSQLPGSNRDDIRQVPQQYHLFVGGLNRTAAHNAVSTYTSTPSVHAGMISYEVRPEIRTDQWFVLYRDQFAKPLNLYAPGTPRIDSAIMDESSDLITWIVRQSFGMGYRNWHTMVKCDPTP